jgi:hypothetical protein
VSLAHPHLSARCAMPLARLWGECSGVHACSGSLFSRARSPVVSVTAHGRCKSCRTATGDAKPSTQNQSRTRRDVVPAPASAARMTTLSITRI